MTAPTLPPLNELLAEHDGESLFIKNTQPGPTVFTTDASRNDGHLTWQGEGDPNGLDVQVVPRDLLKNLQFRNMLQIGIFQIVQDPAIARAALEAQQQAWVDAEQKRRTADPESIFNDPTLDTAQKLVVEGAANANDVHVENCVATPCTTSVILKPNEVGEKPPLCGPHAGLAPQFVAMEDASKPLVNGRAQVRWVRPSMGTQIG